MGMSASQARLLAITSRMNDIELRSQQIANTKIRLADESEQVAQKYTNALNASKFTFTNYKDGKTQVISMTVNNMSSLGSNYRLVASNGKRVVSKSQANSYKTAMQDYARPQWWSNNTDDNHFKNSQAVYSLNEKFGVSSFKEACQKCGVEEGGWDKLIAAGKVTQSEINTYNAQFEEMFNSSSGSTYNNGNSKQDDGVVYIEDQYLSDPNWLYEAVSSGQFKIEQQSTEGWKEISTASDTQIAIASDNSKFALAEAEYNAATQKINNKEKKLDQQLKTMDTEHSALQTEQDSVKSLIKDNVDKSFNLFS